jgi:O-acetyl-ADP-ribose deacetylase (regulator of RNase III)
VWQGGDQGEDQTLASAYRSALDECDRLGLHSVTFPSISTGIFGYPLSLAAPIALATVIERLRSDATSLTLIRFALFDETTRDAYAHALAALQL